MFVAYGAGDTLYVSVSGDEGKTYGPPFKVGAADKLSLGMRRGPRISTHRDAVVITAVYGEKGNGRDGDVVAFRSSDRGLTWSQPVKVNDVPGSAREGLHAMAVAPNGTLACAWLDLRDKGTTLYLSTSRDGGSTWSKNRLVYSSPSGTICECCHPSLAFDQSGKLWVMFRNSLEGARDMYLTSSQDFKGFPPPLKLGQGTWLIKACPMDGGMVATGPKSLSTVWRREGSLFSTGANGAEKAIGAGQQPWIAEGAQGSYLTWMLGSDVLVRTPGSPESVVSSKGNSPVVSSSVDGKLVIAAWTESGIKSVVLSD